MHYLKMTALFVSALTLLSASCEERKTSVEEPQEETQEETLPPVETSEPNSSYQPAFEGQTRIAGVKTTTPYEAAVIAEGLVKPWAVTPLPDGRLAASAASVNE